jgi:uncharacterized protein
VTLTFDQLAWLLPIVAFAFTVESALGFGATVITLALGAHVAPIGTILPAFVPLNLMISAALLFRNKQHVDRRLLFARILPLMAIGLPFGIFGLAQIDQTIARKVFGAFVIVLASAELLASIRKQRSTPRPIAGTIALICAGAIHGAYATGGPLVVWVLGPRLEKSAFRATLSALWLLLNLVLFANFALRGRIDIRSLEASAVLAIGMLLGLWLGEWVHRRVPAEQFRLAIYGLLGLAGASMLS